MTIHSKPIWQENLLNTENHFPRIKSVAETIDSIYKSIRENGASSIDLRTFQSEEINLSHSLAILRCSYHYRTEIPGWKNFLDTTKKALNNNDRNTLYSLKGLYEENLV